MKKRAVSFLLSALCLSGCSGKSASVGIIGGADGPTAVFVTSQINWLNLLGSIGMIAAIILALMIIRRRKK